MEDLGRLFRFIKAVLFVITMAIYKLSNTSSLTVGYVLIVLGILVKIYEKRTIFYAGLDTAADWEPRYGDIMSARVKYFLLRFAFRLLIFMGIVVLFHGYLPVLFQNIFGFLLKILS